MQWVVLLAFLVVVRGSPQLHPVGVDYAAMYTTNLPTDMVLVRAVVQADMGRAIKSDEDWNSVVTGLESIQFDAAAKLVNVRANKAFPIVGQVLDHAPEFQARTPQQDLYRHTTFYHTGLEVADDTVWASSQCVDLHATPTVTFQPGDIPVHTPNGAYWAVPHQDAVDETHHYASTPTYAFPRTQGCRVDSACLQIPTSEMYMNGRVFQSRCGATAAVNALDEGRYASGIVDEGTGIRAAYVDIDSDYTHFSVTATGIAVRVGAPHFSHTEWHNITWDEMSAIQSSETYFGCPHGTEPCTGGTIRSMFVREGPAIVVQVTRAKRNRHPMDEKVVPPAHLINAKITKRPGHAPHAGIVSGMHRNNKGGANDAYDLYIRDAARSSNSLIQHVYDALNEVVKKQTKKEAEGEVFERLEEKRAMLDNLQAAISGHAGGARRRRGCNELSGFIGAAGLLSMNPTFAIGGLAAAYGYNKLAEGECPKLVSTQDFEARATKMIVDIKDSYRHIQEGINASVAAVRSHTDLMHDFISDMHTTQETMMTKMKELMDDEVYDFAALKAEMDAIAADVQAQETHTNARLEGQLLLLMNTARAMIQEIVSSTFFNPLVFGNESFYTLLREQMDGATNDRTTSVIGQANNNYRSWPRYNCLKSFYPEYLATKPGAEGSPVTACDYIGVHTEWTHIPTFELVDGKLDTTIRAIVTVPYFSTASTVQIRKFVKVATRDRYAGDHTQFYELPVLPDVIFTTLYNPNQAGQDVRIFDMDNIASYGVQALLMTNAWGDPLNVGLLESLTISEGIYHGSVGIQQWLDTYDLQSTALDEKLVTMYPRHTPSLYTRPQYAADQERSARFFSLGCLHVILDCYDCRVFVASELGTDHKEYAGQEETGASGRFYLRSNFNEHVYVVQSRRVDMPPLVLQCTYSESLVELQYNGAVVKQAKGAMFEPQVREQTFSDFFNGLAAFEKVVTNIATADADLPSVPPLDLSFVTANRYLADAKTKQQEMEETNRAFPALIEEESKPITIRRVDIDCSSFVCHVATFWTNLVSIVLGIIVIAVLVGVIILIRKLMPHS